MARAPCSALCPIQYPDNNAAPRSTGAAPNCSFIKTNVRNQANAARHASQSDKGRATATLKACALAPFTSLKLVSSTRRAKAAWASRETATIANRPSGRASSCARAQFAAANHSACVLAAWTLVTTDSCGTSSSSVETTTPRSRSASSKALIRGEISVKPASTICSGNGKPFSTY